MRPFFALASLLVAASLACTTSTNPPPGGANGCVHPTATPRVSAPTATPCAGCPVPPVVAVCPTIPPPASPSPRPIATSYNLALENVAVEQLTFTPGSETLLGVIAGDNGKNAVLFQRSNGYTAITVADNSSDLQNIYAANLDLDATGTFLPDGRLAVGVYSFYVWSFRFINQISQYPAATTYNTGLTGDDIGAGYGPEGWLHIISSGIRQERRFNPVSQAWETYGNYGSVTGQIRQLAYMPTGMLLLTTDGVWRRAHDDATQAWVKVFDNAAIQEVNAPLDFPERPETMATVASQSKVALAWLVRANGATLSKWKTVYSLDGGVTWTNPEVAASGAPGEYLEVFPAWRALDGAFDVIGLFRPNVGATTIITARRTSSGWFPPASAQQYIPITPVLAPLDIRRIEVGSAEGKTVVAWEMEQIGNANVFDIYALWR